MFYTLEWACSYGISVGQARALESEEFSHYRNPERIFIAVGDSVQLSNLSMEDLPGRPSEGEFLGCSNRAWKISKAEYEAYIALNAERKVLKDKAERAEKIESLNEKIAHLKKVKLYPTREAAAEAKRRYNDIQNEGGEGFVPHFYCEADLDECLAELEQIEKEM